MTELSAQQILSDMLQIASASDRDAAGELALRIVRERMATTDVSIWRVDFTRRHSVRCWKNSPQAQMTRSEYQLGKIDGKHRGLTAFVIATAQYLNLNNVHDRAERKAKAAEAEWTHADDDEFPDRTSPVLIVPLLSPHDRRRAIGAVRTSRDHAEQFTELERELLEALCAQLALGFALQEVGSFFPTHDYLRLLNDFGEPQTKSVSVLYTDLAGFTTFADHALQRDAEQIIDTVNTFFSLTLPAIYAHQGTVDKYEGDGLIALFNAYSSAQNHSLEAVRCAWDIRTVFLDSFKIQCRDRLRARFGRDLPMSAFEPLSLKVGVAVCKQAIVGTVGARDFDRGGGLEDTRLDLTVIDEGMNIAARLVSDVPKALAKEHRDFDAREPHVLITFAVKGEVDEEFDTREYSTAIRGVGVEGEQRAVYEVLRPK